MILKILTNDEWINPIGHPRWRGIHGECHYEDGHLILWATDPETWSRLHKMSRLHFMINGKTPESIEVR